MGLIQKTPEDIITTVLGEGGGARWVYAKIFFHEAKV